MKSLYLALLISLEAFGPVTPNIQVDFTQVVRAVDPLTFGLDSSGYGNPVFPNDSLEQQRLQTLNLGLMRMELKYAVSGDPNSKIECGGAGCATSVVGDNFIDAIKAVGADPVVITDVFKGNQTGSVTDAVNLVTHFNVTTQNPVHRWILGNEPDNNSITVSEYAAQFNAMYDAMKAVDPTILIGGPAAASFNKTYLTSFLAASGSRVDFVDFHAYGEGSSDNLPQAQLLAQTQNYEDNLNKLEQMIQSAAPARAASIGMEVGEWNMNWNGAGSVANMYTHFNTLWGALTIGHILSGGGLSMQYADKNGPLGALYQSAMPAYGAALDDPMPVYYAHGMFTGEGLFQHFGAVQVAATTTLPLVNVWASDNGKNIVVVNQDPANSQNAVFGLTGVVSGSVDVWMKDPSIAALNPPELVSSSAVVNGSFSYTLTPYSVTVFVVHPWAQFYPVTPCRIADTRSFAGMTGAFGPPSMDAQSTRSFPILSSSCNIPSTAAAYSLNITAVPTGSTMRWLTTWPTGQTEPVASTLNSYNGVVTANAAIVPAGTNGTISIFVSDATDVILDINGYFAPPVSGGLDFYPATPCRIADTRALGGMTGAFGPPSMTAQSTRDFPVPQSSCSVPSTAAAYSLNMTVVPIGDTMRWLTTWPTGQTEPVASTLNSYNGMVVANAALVPAGTNGAISIFVSDATDVLFDINGYFAPPSSGLHFYPVTPCRVADTRTSGGFSGAFGPPSMVAKSTRSFPVAGSCGIPSTAVAYSLNMTAVPSTGYLDYLTTWAAGQPQPVASTLNSWDGQVKANAAIVPAGTNGAISIFVSDATDVLFDANGYFAP